MMKFRVQGLVADLLPNIRLMQASGHFLFNYYADNSSMMTLIRAMYSSMHLILVLVHFALLGVNLMKESGDVNDMATNTITLLFFVHCITKLIYFAVRSKMFYRTFGIWNQSNSHPLFLESNNRHHAIALADMRRLLMIVMGATVLSFVSWTTLTFVGDSVKEAKDPENENVTITVEIPRLLVRAWYPWDAMSGMPHLVSLIYQFYYVFFSMVHSNLMDVLFCSFLIFACEQLQHLKEILKPLMELSATLDTYVPRSADLFRAAEDINDEKKELEYTKDPDPPDDTMYTNVYQRELGNLNFRTGTLQTFGENQNGTIGPNGLTKKQELLVRSAIKYWVERHKHVVSGKKAFALCEESAKCVFAEDSRCQATKYRKTV